MVPVVPVVPRVAQVMLVAARLVQTGAVRVAKEFLSSASPANHHLEVVVKHRRQSHVCRVPSVHPSCQRSRPGHGMKVFWKDQSIPVFAARTMVVDCLKSVPGD